MFLFMSFSVHMETFLLGINLEVELLDYWVGICLAFQSSYATLIYIPVNGYGSSDCFIVQIRHS